MRLWRGLLGSLPSVARVAICGYPARNYQVVNNPKYPNIQKDLASSFATMRALPCDIFWRRTRGSSSWTASARHSRPIRRVLRIRLSIRRDIARISIERKRLCGRVAQQTKVEGGHS